VSPANLLSKDSRNTFPRQRIHKQQQKNCWTLCSVCGPSKEKSVCSETEVGTSFIFSLSKASSCLKGTYTRRTSVKCLGTFETGEKSVFLPPKYTGFHYLPQFFSFFSLSLKKVGYSFFPELPVTSSVRCASTLIIIIII
jgi:hypothetical protein